MLKLACDCVRAEFVEDGWLARWHAELGGDPPNLKFCENQSIPSYVTF